MLRDFKFLRGNPAKNNTDEVENLPLNPRDSPNPKVNTDLSRPPLNTIQEPSRIPKRMPDHDLSGFRPPNKVNRIPTDPKPKSSDTSTSVRTPEKQGSILKHPPCSSVLEPKEDRKLLSSNVNTPHSSRGGSQGNLSYSECNSIKTTPTKSVNKPPNPGFSLVTGSRPMSNMGARIANHAGLSKGSPNSCNLSAINTAEVPFFKLKEDPSFWMEQNVQVLIRVRPLNNMEKNSFGYSRCLKQDSGQSITWTGQPETRFVYDHVACEAIDQETLFRMVGLPMVENCLSGYNSCMFAYGQTGSGKTHTMLGDIEGLEVKPSPNRGMTPRIFEYLFARIRAEEETRQDEHLKYNCKCSFLEIYNEQITDLLDPSSSNLMLREDMKKGVYVENLSEFEVQTVGDILHLLTQGASNRKVAATNMNRESSRSHSVFTCVIESTWEKDSAANFRFARLNLVDLAGSERQKSSGAEGERLKEAANINKSLSTLGHVIMVLVDVANGKPRHIPYRDSRLTFLLQDSLGGNSKTMIIANVSPSICSAAETLNTLKFAQRAKLIQNNAVINEDSSGDVVALKHQIRILKEELSALKREKVTRSLSFGGSIIDTSIKNEADDCKNERTPGKENGVVRVSNKQLKSLEATLAGALRREQMAETTVQQLEAEIQMLNRLVSQKEEDTWSRKMMLKFREDKIKRMESVLGGLMSMDDYLVRENKALSEENQLLREKVDKNPEVTRFAVENIRLLDQVRKFQDLYEEGEKEILMDEVCELRNQLISSLDGNLTHFNHLDMKVSNESNRIDNENNLLHKESKITLSELEDSKKKLNCCMEENAKLQREVEELRALLNVTTKEHDCSAEIIKESIVEVPMINNPSIMNTGRKKEVTRSESLINAEDIMHSQLELDIVKIVLQEQMSTVAETEEMIKSLSRELQFSKETVVSVSKDYLRVLEELKNAKLVIEELESQQIQTINEIEEKELEISNLKHAEGEYSPLEAKLSKMHRSLEKAKKLNMFYKSDLASQESNENEADVVRKQVEAETAEVIICLQEELLGLQQEVYDSKAKEMETRERLGLLEAMRVEWDLIACEMEDILFSGDESLRDMSDQIDVISDCIPGKRSLVSKKIEKMKNYISEKEILIEELSRCLKDALDRRDEMDRMLSSLRGAALVMTEAHQQECFEKDNEIFLLTSELKSKTSTVEELRSLIEHGKTQLKMTSSCATAAFVIVNRLWESNCSNQALVICGEETDEILETREKLKELNSGVKGDKFSSESAVMSVNGGDDSMVLLKKEIEFGLKRLQEVQAEMDKLRFEKEEIFASEKLGRKSIESTINHVVILGDAIDNFRDELELKVNAMEGKIGKLEKMIQELFASWFQQREFLENGLGGVKVIAAQKTIEASCFLEKFEEVQDTVKEADIVINELMIANEALKINAYESKAKENNLTNERDVLAKEFKSLKKQYHSDFDIMRRSLSELENVIAEIQSASANKWTFMCTDFFSMKSQFQESTESIRSMLEDVWSEIIAKDCTMSVLHLCHMGILLETANGLNVENSLLEHGLCESNSVVSELREHNLKSRKELEMCRVLKGKLLTDIKRGFNRISSKVDENGEISLMLASFEKKIQNLQFQEEMMLEKSNDMGSELMLIMKELDLCNKCTLSSIMEHERLQKEKDDLIQYQEERFMVELLAKDFELLVLSSDLKQVALLKEDADKARINTYEVFENLKNDIFFKSLELASCELMLLEKENEYEKLLGDYKMRELSLETSSSHISELDQKTRRLQNELEIKNAVCKENEELQVHLKTSKDGYGALLQELEDKKARFDIENQELRDSIARLEEDLSLAKVEILNHNVSQCTLQEENASLRNKLRVSEVNQSEYLNLLDLKMLKSVNLAENVDKASCKIINLIEEKFVGVEDKFRSIAVEMDSAYKFLDQFECMENIALRLDSETPSLEKELSRKDDILKGLLFDLSLLQESASNSKDQKDEMEKVLASLSILETDFELKSLELENSVAKSQSLEAQLQEKMEKISALELDLSRHQEVINSLSGKNAEVLDGAKEAFDAKNSMEKDLLEARIKIEDLETEVADMEMVLCQMSEKTASLKGDLDAVACQRDELGSKVVVLSKELETVRALAEENEAVAIETQERAEIQKVNAEEKEEEVRLLEKSIEELEFTINVLEQKVDIVKGEAERQRLQREELELELLGVKEQMQNIKNNDSDLKSFERDNFRKLLFVADEKENNLKEALQRAQLLESEIAARNAEISQCKDHIRELNLHAEAQATEHKLRFKALEAMVEKLKSDVTTTSHGTSSPKKTSKSRGTGSPFKCIGLGLVQQIKSEKAEELTAGRQRIEELEGLATSRQKEILMLKARLASTESMTHDVIRDLLGVKLNMKNYANLMDNQQLRSLIGKAHHHNVDEVKDQEVANLKLQIDEFVKERSGWLEEIERKQAEMMSAHVALEKLRQQEQLLATENEMLKTENANHKKKVRGLEVEVTKLSGQQNIQQRIHHHAKIKEENNSLRCQNEDLRFKLRKTEAILSRVKDELAQFRAANGKNPFINFDEEEQLEKKLKEMEEEKLQLAQKLLGLCTTVLKAAGISKPTSEVSTSVAEEALVHLKNRVASLEMELEDAKLKNRISDERSRLSELRPQTSTESSSRSDVVRSRVSQTPFFSALDR